MYQVIANYRFFFFLILVAVSGPLFLEPFNLVAGAGYLALAIGGLGLAFVWGMLGVLSLGHTAFFGLGAYAYAICAMAAAEPAWGVLAAVVLPVTLALGLGCFLFFSRLSDVYLAIITLCIALILFSFFSSTSDPYYQIAGIPLGGFNGINGVPGLSVPGMPEVQLTIEQNFIFCGIALAATYAILTWLRMHRIGRVMLAVKENELRSDLLGYNVRRYKLLGYVISAAVAGLSGALYTSVSGFVGPNVFDLSQASQFVLWVIAGGVGTLAGPIIASVAFQCLATYLGTRQGVSTELVFGLIILGFVLLIPQGLLPWIMALGRQPRDDSSSLRVSR